MYKFIRLTDLASNRKILVNVANIITIDEGKGDDPSVIYRTSPGNATHVKESGQYIRNRLKDLGCEIS